MKKAVNKYLVAFILMISGRVALSQDYTQAQDRIKSIYVYNFLKGIRLPKYTDSEKINLCMLDNSSLFQELEALANSKKVDGKKLTISKISTLSECYRCDLIFMEDNETARVLKRSDDCTSLIITCGFFEKALSNISLMYEDQKLQFSVNESLCLKLGFKIAPQLKSLSNQKIVQQ